jgi:hypothetical protein
MVMQQTKKIKKKSDRIIMSTESKIILCSEKPQATGAIKVEVR